MTKKRLLRTTKDLISEKIISEEPNNTRQAIEQVSETFAMSITPEMASLMSNSSDSTDYDNSVSDKEDPIYKQFVPDPQELNIKEYELSDPISDLSFSPVTGLVHRYPDRCLLKPINVCPVYCRFCFRREQIGPKTPPMSTTDLQKAYDYISAHSEIWEVILTGGDPLILPPKKLHEILIALEAIPHVEIIRIHTRVPVVDPDRISDSLLKALKIKKPVFVLLHANHSKEFTSMAQAACARLIDSGVPMFSQSVLLKGINDNVDTLAALMRCFLKNRIKPYYLHHGDLARGTAHFRTSIKKGQALMRALRGKYSGLCQPLYIIDIPGGYGKIPLSPPYITGEHPDYQLMDYRGNVHCYCDKESDN